MDKPINIEKYVTDFCNIKPSASYSKGYDDNPVVLLFESPGEQEIKRLRPLAGQTGLNYDVVVSIVGLICGIDTALKFEKNCAMVVNMLKCQIDNSERQSLLRRCNELFSQKMVEGFLTITKRKIALIAFGAIACSFAKFIANRNATAFNTILLCPYLNTTGLAKVRFGESNLNDAQEGVGAGRLRDLKKIEAVGWFVAQYQMCKGIYGWNELVKEWKEKTGEDVRWGGDCPQWMVRE